MDLLETLVTAALMGMIGQGIRAIVGLKSSATLAAQKQDQQAQFDAAYFSLSLMLGGIAGVLGALGLGLQTISAVTVSSDPKVLLGLAACGYAGSDFVENAFTNLIPSIGALPTGIGSPAGAAGVLPTPTPTPAPTPAPAPHQVADSSGVHNSYPDLEVIEFQKTTVAMADFVVYLKKSGAPKDVQIAVYAMWSNESGHGRSGINNNYGGFQADVGRWNAKYTKLLTGTCVITDSGGHMRRFICFKDFKGCVDMFTDVVTSRGLFVGGTTHLITKMTIGSPSDWIVAYYREWVTGSATAEPPAPVQSSMGSLYAEAQTALA
jgi:hypothetical protein